MIMRFTTILFALVPFVPRGTKLSMVVSAEDNWHKERIGLHAEMTRPLNVRHIVSDRMPAFDEILEGLHDPFVSFGEQINISFFAETIIHGASHAHVHTRQRDVAIIENDRRLRVLHPSSGHQDLYVKFPLAEADSLIHQNVFNDIYTNAKWGRGNENGGGSGSGSSLEYTAGFRKQLVELLQNLTGVKALLDTSCGSFLWMPLVLDALPEIEKYHGLDVACGKLEEVKSLHETHNRTFSCADYSTVPFPKGYDVIFSRDSLQHVGLAATYYFLGNALDSGARWLVVGSYVDSALPNMNIKPGDAYSIDLTKPPFLLGPAYTIMEESAKEGPDQQKHLLVFDLTSVTWQDDFTLL